jgi:hypothetical protein
MLTFGNFEITLTCHEEAAVMMGVIIRINMVNILTA